MNLDISVSKIYIISTI